MPQDGGGEMGHTGFTLCVRPSVRPSVRLSLSLTRCAIHRSLIFLGVILRIYLHSWMYYEVDMAYIILIQHYRLRSQFEMIIFT